MTAVPFATSAPASDPRLLRRLERYAPFILVLLLLIAVLPGILALPPLDRDESRFALASKQMLESGDYLLPSYAGEAQNRRPVGAHWLQAASVRLLGSVEAHEIWVYRLPSLAGAIASGLALWALGRRLFDSRIGFLAALMIGASLSLNVEALTAKPDSLLLLTVVLAQLGLAEAWRRGGDGERPGWGFVLLFWSALAAGILIKGPVTPLIAVLTLLTLCFWERRWRWLAGLRPLVGVPLLLLLVLPWFLAVTLGRDASFLAEAANEHIWLKITGGEEGRGAPPGFHLLSHFFFFWPGALFALPSVIAAWHERRRVPALRFCLAWLVPAWILFELLPVKLPHYVLPTYPALALMVAWAVLAEAPALGARFIRWMQLLLALGALVLAGGMIALPLLLDQTFVWQSLPAAALILAATWTAIYLAWRQRRAAALLVGSVLGALWLGWQLGVYLPKLEGLFPSNYIVSAWQRHAGPEGPPLASTGYREPSLVFLAGSDTRFGSPQELAAYLAATPQAVVVVTGRMRQAFLMAAAALQIRPQPLESFSGVNYARGSRLTFTLYGKGSDATGAP